MEIEELSDNQLKTYLNKYIVKYFEYASSCDKIENACNVIIHELCTRGIEVTPTYKFSKSKNKPFMVKDLNKK